MSNYKFKTTNIRGKQYVGQRTHQVRHRAVQELDNMLVPALDSEQCVCKQPPRSLDVFATGHAHEVQGASTSTRPAVENCETSATRALAMLGIGIHFIASLTVTDTSTRKHDVKKVKYKRNDTEPSTSWTRLGYTSSGPTRKHSTASWTSTSLPSRKSKWRVSSLCDDQDEMERCGVVLN